MFCEATPFQNADSPDVHRVFRGKQHVHLMGDDERELRLFASEIGMKSGWLQRDRFGLAHFDCTGRFMSSVMADERVAKLSRAEFVGRWRELRRQSAGVRA